MSEPTKLQKPLDPFWYRAALIRQFCFALFVLGIIFCVLSITTKGNYTVFSLFVILISGINIILNKLNRIQESIAFLLVSSSLLIIVQSYFTKSAYLLTVVVALMILSSILLDFRFTSLMFVVFSIIILIFILLRILTIDQMVHPDNKIALVNNISVLIPMLLLGYVISFIIHKVLIGTIQKQREMQDLLIKQEKLASIQVLAGGIAHDFNNLLTGILGNIDLVVASGELQGENLEFVEEAKKASLKARNLTGQLLTFSKAGDPVSSVIPSLKKMVEDTVRFTLRGRHSKYLLDMPDNLWAIVGDQIQINQVFQNLVLNADEAMPKGGFIRIIAENYEVSESSISKSELTPGKYVKFSVIDAGIGIPEENLNKIFDPYYTTKPHGTGLGLAICYSIIKKHQGSIQITSKVGEGTTIEVYFPATLHVVPENNTPVPIKSRFSGNVLVLEDKSYVSSVLKNMLNQIGFEVDFARNSQDFLAKFNQSYQNASPYDILILDLTIPGDRGGGELIKEVREKDGAIKVIVSSGYSDIPVMTNYKQYGFNGVLRKPYVLEELTATIRKLYIT